MFMPPDHRNVRHDIPVVRPKPFSAAAWSLIAGTAFAITRFLVSLIFVAYFAAFIQRPTFEGTTWIVSIATGACAGIGGGLLWRRFQRPLTPNQGALVGLFAAASSYVGVFLFAG